jgi:CBS domain-containing protein
MRLLLSAAYNDDEFVEGLVQDVMATTDLETGSPGHDIVDVAMSMLDHKPRRRPVVDEGGGLIGQVTCRQILRAIKEVRGYKDLTER